VYNLREFRRAECSPTFKYDSLYVEILSGHSQLIFILSAQAMHQLLEHYLQLFNLSYRIFEPFYQFQEHLDYQVPKGDSPLDFIADPNRAGLLYMDPQSVAETVVLQWILRAREFVRVNIAVDVFPDLWVPFLSQSDIAFKQGYIDACSISSSTASPAQKYLTSWQPWIFQAFVTRYLMTRYTKSFMNIVETTFSSL
jgi:hypothetical protein